MAYKIRTESPVLWWFSIQKPKQLSCFYIVSKLWTKSPFWAGFTSDLENDWILNVPGFQRFCLGSPLFELKHSFTTLPLKILDSFCQQISSYAYKESKLSLYWNESSLYLFIFSANLNYANLNISETWLVLLDSIGC